MKNIILIGMPGAGKSTVGVLLAKSMGYDFVDADLVIQKQQGTKLQNIIDERGLDGFKQAEEQALLSINDKKAIMQQAVLRYFRPQVWHISKKTASAYISELTSRSLSAVLRI